MCNPLATELEHVPHAPGCSLHTDPLFHQLPQGCCCPAAFGAVHLLLLPNCCTTCPLPHPLWQALITGAFSIVWQSMALGCFPRLRVKHTSHKVGGQIYIAAINWMLLVLCIAVVAGFRSGTTIGNAYGESATGAAVELPADEVLQLSW